MSGRECKLTITERRQAILRTMIRSGTHPQVVAQRAWMIPSAIDQFSNEAAVEHVGREPCAIVSGPKI